MKELNFTLLTETVGLLDIKEGEAEVMVTRSKERQEPTPPPFFPTQDDYNAYREYVLQYIKDTEQLIRDARALQTEIRELEYCIIEMLPFKAIWFKLVGHNNRWVSKTSDNLCSSNGNRVHFHHLTDNNKLPNLTTC